MKKKNVPAIVLVAFGIAGAPTLAEAAVKERIRFDCSLYRIGRDKELEEFVLRLGEATQQFVTPERKYFIDIKEVQIAVEVPQEAPPAPEPKPGEKPLPPPAPLPPVIKQEPGLQVTLAVYTDFLAKYESTENLLGRASQEFPIDTREMAVMAKAADASEGYEVKCTRLDKVTIPKIEVDPHGSKKKKKKLPTQKEIDNI